jgi:putative ABC transport system ATP-binding protein
MADDDVPTAHNFLNASISSERRNRNADVAPVAPAPFGDVPRAYDSSAADTRAKAETRPATMQSTVQIGIASLPVAPQPTVVPSPPAGTGSYDPDRANTLPEPIVIPAPQAVVVAAEPVATELLTTEPAQLPAPTAHVAAASVEPSATPTEAVVQAVEELRFDPSVVPVDDISESPLARLLAAQNLDQTLDQTPPALEPYPGHLPNTAHSTTNTGSGSIESAAVMNPSVFVSAEPTASTSTETSFSSSVNPFAAPKVGNIVSIFDTAPLAGLGADSPAGSALWSGEARQPELTPMSSAFGTQAPTPSQPVAPVVRPQSPEPQPEAKLEEAPERTPALVLPVEPIGEPAALRTAPLPPQVPVDFLAETSANQALTEALGEAESAKPQDTAAQPTQTRLSPEALQQVYTFDDENPEDLVPLGVSDRLVLRWVANASEALRVSTVGLSIGWPNQKPLVTNLDIDLVSGDMLIIDGPERSGKTALLKTFAGHVAPQQGDVSLDGHSLGSVEGTDFRRREALSLSYVGASSLLVSDLSLVENIELPLLAEGVSPHDARPAALSWLESAGLSANAHLPAGSLSTSDARIATVIRTLICGPALVCVDDVTSGMGVSSARMVLALLEHAQATGAVLLIATNDARLEFDGGYRATIEAGELVPVE